MEPSLLSSLIRLMSYIVPQLHTLKDKSHLITQFASMTTTMIELSGLNQSVILEGMAFFESIVLHSSSEVIRDIFQSIEPLLTKLLFSRKLVHNLLRRPEKSFNTCNNSLSCQITTLIFLEQLMCADEETITQSFEGDSFRSSVIALLEFVYGSRQYPCSQYPRALSVSPTHTRVPIDARMLEIKLCTVISNMLSLDMRRTNCDLNIMTKWLLFSIELISMGELGHSFGDNTEETDSWKSKVFNSIKCARDNARDVTKSSGNTVHWQLKFVAAKIACVTITNIASIIKDQKDKSIFDLVFLREKLSTCSHGHTHILLHLKELLNFACSLSTITMDQCELYTLQSVGLDLLCLLIDNFAKTKDVYDSSPEANEFIIQNFSSQIIPSVKQALGSCDIGKDDEPLAAEGARELFIKGCDSLCLVVEKGLINETTALRRILKQLLPTQEEAVFCEYPDSIDSSQLHIKPKSFVENRMSVLLPRIGKVSCLAKIFTYDAIGLITSELSSTISEQVKRSENELVVISAALAIDSFKLQSLVDKSKMKSGLTFQNIQDVSINVQNEMMKNWAYFACLSSILSMKILTEANNDTKKRDILRRWIEKLSIVLTAGFEDCLYRLNEATNLEDIQDAEQICTICLVALDTIISSQANNEFIKNDTVSQILNRVLDKLLNPWLDTSMYIDKTYYLEQIDSNEMKIDADAMIKNYQPKCDEVVPKTLMKKCCIFVENATRTTNSVDSTIMKFLLKPLSMIEDDNISFGESKVYIMTSHIWSLTHLLKNEESGLFDNDIIRSLFDVCMKLLSLDEHNHCHEAVSSLIQCCFLHKGVLHQSEVFFHVKDAATTGQWTKWELLCRGSKETDFFVNSLEYVVDTLTNFDNDEEHLSVLTALFSILKVHSECIPNVMTELGAHLLTSFKVHGTKQQGDTFSKKKRLLICSNCMKIIMLSFQFMLTQSEAVSSDSKQDFDGEVAEYIATIFEALVVVIEFNGLPNQQQYTKEGSDVVFGQMCAQFFVHVLRTYPTSFKLCMSSLNDRSRNILETSVRADMSGYQAHAPVKKKLNIKTFVPNSR